MSKSTENADPSRREVKIEDFVQDLVPQARDSLALLSDEEIAAILMAEITSATSEAPALQAKLTALYFQCKKEEQYWLRLQPALQKLQNEPGSLGVRLEVLQEKELKCFLYRLIHNSLGREGRPESAHYAALSYNYGTVVEKTLREANPGLIDESADAMAYHYNHSRSLEVLGQNSREGQGTPNLIHFLPS